MTPRVTSDVMRAKVWPLLCDCIDEGIAYGLRRFHKHRSGPELAQADQESLAVQIGQAVENAIAERFEFEGDE